MIEVADLTVHYGVKPVLKNINLLRNGEVAAFDTLAGLRSLTGVQGSLGDVLERLLYPGMERKLAAYFAGRAES